MKIKQGLQPRFIVSPLSYRPGGPGAGGGMAGEASRPRSQPPRRPRPRPDLQLPWRAGVAFLSAQRPDRGGLGAAGSAMRPPTRRGVHPAGACTPNSRGEGPGDGAVERYLYWVADELYLAGRVLAAEAGLPAIPRHPPVIKP